MTVWKHRSERPPAKAGGFLLRLKAESIRHPAMECLNWSAKAVSLKQRVQCINLNSSVIPFQQAGKEEEVLKTEIFLI